MAPTEGEVGRYTDKYFAKTRAIVERFGDARVTYAVFMRRPVLSTPRLAVDWLRQVAAERGADVAGRAAARGRRLGRRRRAA